jgi:hypothetical protein
MRTNLSKYKDDLERLVKIADDMLQDLELTASRKKPRKGEAEPGSVFVSQYQSWYTEASEVIRQILPGRLNEFQSLYHCSEKSRPAGKEDYAIRDWLLGVRSGRDSFTGTKYFDDIGFVMMQFQMQYQILESSKLRFESTLFDIGQIVRADLFDSELESARELLKKGFLRAAGAVAGVVAEKSLSDICQSHNVPIKKKNPTINTYNDALKDADVVEVPQWRFIQRLGDLRNLCDHNRDREPTKDEVTELIDGIEKLTKTVF